MQIDLAPTSEASYSGHERANTTSCKQRAFLCSPLVGSCVLTMWNWDSLCTSFAFSVDQDQGELLWGFTLLKSKNWALDVLTYCPRELSRLTCILFTAGEKRPAFTTPCMVEVRLRDPYWAHAVSSDSCHGPSWAIS